MSESGYLKLLQSIRYLPFFISQVLTNLSDGLIAVIIIYFAIKLEASAWQLGVITFFITLSRGFLGPLGGLISDRMNRKYYLIGIEVLRTFVMFITFILFVNDQLNIWVLAFVGILISTLFAISVPASKAVIPKLVEDHELQLANALIQTITWPAFFLGSGLLAIILPFGIELYTFLIVALSFFISSALLLFIPAKAGMQSSLASIEKEKSLWEELTFAYSELKSYPVTHARVFAYGVFTFFWRGTLQIILPLVVISTLNSPTWVYGAIMFASGASEFIANLIVGKLKLKKPLVFTFSCEILIGLGILIIYVSFSLPVPEVGVFIGAMIIGIAAATIDIPLLTVIQQNVDERNIGKVISYWFTVGSAGGALGSLAFGIIFEFVEIELGIALIGILVLVAGIQMMLWAKRHN